VIQVKNETVNLNLMAILLGFFLVTKLIHHYLPLVVIGMFYPLLSKKGKLIIIAFVFLSIIYDAFRLFLFVPLTTEMSLGIIRLLSGGIIFTLDNVPKIFTKFNIPDLPPFLRYIVALILFGIFIIYIIASLINILLMIPCILTGYLLVIIMYGKLEGFAAMLLDDMQKLTLFIQLYYLLLNIEYSIAIPFLSYHFLKIIGFYKRIPIIGNLKIGEG